MAKEHNLEYWRDRVHILEWAAESADEFLAKMEAVYFEGLAREQINYCDRATFEKAKEWATKTTGTLEAARACLAQAEADEADDKFVHRIRNIAAGQKKLLQYQDTALNKLNLVIKALCTADEGAAAIFKHADSQLKGLLNDRYQAFALMMVSRIAEKVPELIEPLARAAANSAENSKRFSGKSLADTSIDFVGEFEKRLRPCRHLKPSEEGSF